VIELIATELDDVRVPPEMLGMTRVTLQRGGRASEAAMESALRANVGGDLFVARQAKLRLPAAIRAVVTVCTAFFVLGVCFGELARHEQCLRRLRVSPRYCEQAEQ